eukprot:1094670-Amphidinium_carterae.1
MFLRLGWFGWGKFACRNGWSSFESSEHARGSWGDWFHRARLNRRDRAAAPHSVRWHHTRSSKAFPARQARRWPKKEETDVPKRPGRSQPAAFRDLACNSSHYAHLPCTLLM